MSMKPTKQNGRQPLKKLISEAEKIEARVVECEKQCDTARKWAGDARGKVAVCEHLVLDLQDKEIKALSARLDTAIDAICTAQDKVSKLHATAIDDHAAHIKTDRKSVLKRYCS